MNRRTLNADTRDITLTLNTSGVAKEVLDVYSGKLWIISPNGSFTDSFTPGEGKLYRISPAAWSGTKNIVNVVTIQSGATLNVNAGTTLKFASGTGLTANGRLNVNGSSSSMVTMTTPSGTGSYGSWGSIILSGSGANNSTINYANILYANEININGVSNVQILNSTISNTINGVNAYNSNGYVQSNTFSYQRDHGIVSNVSSLICNYNTISKSNKSGVALLLTGGSVNYTGSVLGNDISGYNWGICTSWGSYSELSDETHTSNRAINCLYGIRCYQSSEIFMSSKWNGHNSIHDNTYYNAYVYSSSNVYANTNYWGWPVPTAKFYFESGSYLDTSSPLSSDPWGGQYAMTNGDNSNGVQSSTLSKSTNSTLVSISKPSDPALQARELRRSGKKREAFDLLKSEIDKKKFSREAILEIYALNEDQLGNEVEQVLSSISKDNSPLAQYLYGLISSRKGESTTALRVLENLSATPFEKAGKLAQFYIYLYNEEDIKQAGSLLKEITAENDDEELELSLAQHALESYSQSDLSLGKQILPKKSDGQTVVEIPSKFELLQNYPNPFNPTTIISFSLPEANYVRLAVYDYLGRQITLLVDGFTSEGKHEVKFDASKLSSGIYFYKIVSGRNIATKKLLLLK